MMLLIKYDLLCVHVSHPRTTKTRPKQMGTLHGGSEVTATMLLLRRSTLKLPSKVTFILDLLFL